MNLEDTVIKFIEIEIEKRAYPSTFQKSHPSRRLCSLRQLYTKKGLTVLNAIIMLPLSFCPNGMEASSPVREVLRPLTFTPEPCWD